MKRTIAAAFGAAAVSTLVGCGAETSAAVPTGADLKGTWNQAGAGYENGQPVRWDNQTVVIDEADGQGFAGYKEYTRAGEQPQKESVNGVIGPAGEILIVDEDGHFTGRLVDGTLRGQYAEVGDDATAINLELTRQ